MPSRFYHKPSSKRPLAGKRVSLSDPFDVQGAKTTLSSRAWSQLYPAADTSAAYVKKLLDLGAVVVGKTKTTQFTTGLQWVDQHPPVNPRGDRYHEASGSSAGAAASLAGYRWLDFAVGADCELSWHYALSVGKWLADHRRVLCSRRRCSRSCCRSWTTCN